MSAPVRVTTLPAEVALEMLRRMMRIRSFEAAAERLKDRGELVGPLHSSAGQEGVCVGACTALRDDDYMTGHHRSHGHPIAKGADVKHLVAELLGKGTGVCHGLGGSMHLADFAVGSLGESAIVGSSMPIAVGAALAARLQSSDRVCLSFFGDGANNAGIFHESLNLASIWDLGVIFVCENNLYALTTPFEAATSVARVADRAVAYGMPGVVVDGQDVLAVFDVVSTAAERARRGDGPTLIEALTYRYGGHSHGLGKLSGGRAAEEIEFWKSRDPIRSLCDRLLDDGMASEDDIAEAQRSVDREIELAVAFARESRPPTIDMAAAAMWSDPDMVALATRELER